MTAPNNRERILPRLIDEEIKESFINYSMSVIVSRALPDVRDGLKPVHRRVLYAMNELGLVPGRPYKKSATVVGDVLGKYHPHGDQSVYDALVRMVQDFSLRYPLVDGQGNFGSVEGDPAAAYRYTEARLTPAAVEMLADIDKNTVDFVPNFDDRLQEPRVLPSGIPNLLVNGSSGIAVGMATNIPPHNLREIVAATVALIDNPDATPAELRKLVKGPDFPTGGYIYGRQGIKDYQETGRGRIVMRARAVIEEKESSNKSQIVVTEIPYQVNKARLIESIAELVRDKKMDGISDLRDESDRDGMRVVIELKRDAIPRVVLNQLYKHTQMQSTFGVIMLALVPDPATKRLELMKEELHRVAEKYGDARRTEITSDQGEFTIEDLIAEEDMVVTISHSGYIKRTSVSTYKRQRRGGRGNNGQLLKDEDFVEHLFIASTHDYILFFTDDGRCFWLKVHEIPEAGRASKGKPVVNLINVTPDTKISALVPVREFSDSQFLLFVTKQGTVKKTALSQYSNPRASGIKAIKIESGDELIDVQITSGSSDIVLATKHGLP